MALSPTNQTSATAPKKGTLPGWAKLLLKVLVSGVCLWYVAHKIDWQYTGQLLRRSQPAWLIFATIFFVASKVLSAFRLQLYFQNIAVPILSHTNLKLYWLGMFYNLFLPGGIGGDAYKVMLLNQRFSGIGIKKLSAAVLLDRISGVAGLAILAAILYGFIFQPAWHAWLLPTLVVPGIFIFYGIVKRWFPSFVSSFYATLYMGLGVQMLQVICVYGIMQSIGIHQHLGPYQLLFLVSSIVAIFPFTIGGLGAREMVFLWGAQSFGLLQNEAVFVSLLFYFITAIVSLVGIVWVYRSPMPAQA